MHKSMTKLYCGADSALLCRKVLLEINFLCSYGSLLSSSSPLPDFAVVLVAFLASIRGSIIRSQCSEITQRVLQNLIRIIHDHVLHSRRACNYDRLIQPRVSLISSFSSHMKPHAIVRRISNFIPKTLKNSTLACPCPRCLEVNHSAIVCL